jgi:hypothetical protein
VRSSPRIRPDASTSRPHTRHVWPSHRLLPWPFEDDKFPARLGVAVMHTVLNGEMPALQVVHAAEDWWRVADGVNSPNGDASTTAHMQHVLELDPTLAELATLAPGFQADRDDVESPWVVSPFAWGDD